MNDDVLRKLMASQQAEQQEAGMGQLARLCGTFYRELSGTMPAPLARQLVRDWFYLLYCKSMWPDAPPQMPSGDE